MTRALDIITSAYERCNRLSPGEVLSADDTAFGLRRLNELVDELAADKLYLLRGVLTSAAQTGHITLGAGSWTAVNAGDEIVSATANGVPMDPITMQQYNELRVPTTTGLPRVWAWDGFATVYLYPVPAGQTIKLLTRATIGNFADSTTDYTLADGWYAALSAALAVRIAPTILGGIPPALEKAEKKAMGGIGYYDPAIIDVDSFTGSDGMTRSVSRLF